MHFPSFTTLCFHFLFCQLISSSRDTFSGNGIIPKDDSTNVLERFFVNLNEAYLQKYEPRQVAVVGASNQDLQQVQPLFESHPYSVCKGTERCPVSQQFIEQSSMIVLVFLEDLSEETFEKNTKILLPCRKCEVFFISNGMIEVNDVRFILTLAVKHNVVYSKFAHVRKNEIKLYSDFYATNCITEIRLVTVWRPGVSLEKLNRWDYRTYNMNKCPVSVISLNFKPKMIITENKNGTLTVVGGREGKLLLTLAAKLNFSINLRYPLMEDRLNYSRKGAIIRDVTFGISEIGIGRLRPTNHMKDSIAISLPYDNECETWGVPRVIRWSNNIIWVEFSWKVWLFVGLVFALGCIIAYANRNITMSKIGQRTSVRSVTIFLDAIALHLGNPVLYISSYTGGRFMLIAYLYYAMVITTAYRTSLASIFATDQGTPTIIDAQGIINADIDVGGSLFDYNILKDQINDSEITATLLKRFVIKNNSTETWNRLAYRHDYALLARRSSLEYERLMIVKEYEPFAYDILNDCVLSHPTVMVFPARSFLREPADDVILRLMESGIMQQWDSDESNSAMQLELKTTKKYFEKRTVDKFLNVFILYSICISISLFTFIIELLVPRLY